MTHPLPILNAANCVGCGACVAVCPTGCLEAAGPTPWLPRPGDCVACAACAVVCPEAAVHVGPGPVRGSAG